MADQFFETLAAETEPSGERAPSRLKARIYSSLIARQAPLLSLSQTPHVCVFERLIQIAPVGETAKSWNCCRVCHARWLAERLESPPIWWANCPYAGFKNS
jgi:hypothetical protein